MSFADQPQIIPELLFLVFELIPLRLKVTGDLGELLVMDLHFAGMVMGLRTQSYNLHLSYDVRGWR